MPFLLRQKTISSKWQKSFDKLLTSAKWPKYLGAMPLFATGIILLLVIRVSATCIKKLGLHIDHREADEFMSECMNYPKIKRIRKAHIFSIILT